MIDRKDGYKRERRGIRKQAKAYGLVIKAAIIVGMILAGAHIVNQLDKVMAEQPQLVKTQTDAMDQLMWIRQDILVLEEYIYLLEEEIENIKENKMLLTRDERDLVERVVMAEARGGTVRDMAGVAQAIRDRSRYWGKSIEEVCFSPGQFALPCADEVSPEAAQAVWAVFNEGMSALEVPTTHFHNNTVNPYWAASKVSRGSIGNHRFFF